MVTANDPRGEPADATATDDPIDSADLTVWPDSGESVRDGSVCAGTDLLGLLVQRPAMGVCVLSVTGELDALSAPLLGNCLQTIATCPAHLIVDLLMVRFLGSSGLNCLLDARELVQRSRGRSCTLPAW